MLIEIVSLRIRPITLRVRLAANITAGHILIALLGGYQLVLLPLEILVAFVQPLVFTLLLRIYLAE